MKVEMDTQIKQMLEEKIIEPSVSEYNSPIFLVPKKPLPGTKDKRFRLVVDFRQLNKKIMSDVFPLKRIDETLDELGRAKYFSVIDLHSVFGNPNAFFDAVKKQLSNLTTL
jgi:hypothetical protein